MNENENVKTIGNSISKSILYLCLAAIAGMWIINNNLNENTIEQCEVACSNTFAQMGTVTAKKCICIEKKKDKTSQWVLPRK